MSRVIAFILAEATGIPGPGEPLATLPQQRGPQYASAAVPKQRIIEERHGAIIKTYQRNTLLIEKSAEVQNPFSPETFALRSQLIQECYQLAKPYKIQTHMTEEYAVLVVDHFHGSPEDLCDKHGAAITSFLKSEPLALDAQEITHTLSAQLKYAKQDLLIIDWDGACVFEPSGQVDATIELLQLGNLQLLQYRLLDADVDRRLRHVEKLVRLHGEHHPWRFGREVRRGLTEIIRVRSNSIMEFDAIQREIKLIGDWYSARLYGLISRKFKLDDWRKSVREKLESLEDIYDIVAQNFRISSQTFLEAMIQIGWLTLLTIELFQLWKK